MKRWQIIIASEEFAIDLAHKVARRLSDAWPCDPRCDVSVVASSSVTDDAIEKADGIVIVSTQATDSMCMLRFVARIEERGIALVALTVDESQAASTLASAGVLVESIETDPALICRSIRGLLHRQPAMDRLQSELNIAQRFHGGLKQEIAHMHDELQLAGAVQRELLPDSLPEVLGVSFASLWRPCSYVAGDIYDIKRLDEDHVGLFIADAVGHGVPAALMTMIISHSLQMKEVTSNAYRIVPPMEVLARLNEALFMKQGGPIARFATAVCCVINCRARTMTLAGAGHPPPILLKASGETQDLLTPGGLLGIFEEESFGQIEVPLDLGDRLVLYSDGFEQAFPEREDEVFDPKRPTTRYREEFLRLHDVPDAPGMIQAVTKRLDEQSGSLNQQDDLTLLCMHAGPITAPNTGHSPGKPATASRR